MNPCSWQMCLWSPPLNHYEYDNLRFLQFSQQVTIKLFEDNFYPVSQKTYIHWHTSIDIYPLIHPYTYTLLYIHIRIPSYTSIVWYIHSYAYFNRYPFIYILQTISIHTHTSIDIEHQLMYLLRRLLLNLANIFTFQF